MNLEAPSVPKSAARNQRAGGQIATSKMDSPAIRSEAARFVEEMLCWIRREFFAQHSDKRFYQERLILIQAITWPARWMNERGASLPASGYRRSFGTVVEAIKRKSNRAKIRRSSVYFLHSVRSK